MKPTTLNRFADVMIAVIFVAIYGSLFVAMYHPFIGFPLLICFVCLGALLENVTHNKKNSKISLASV